jgi:hypothetical protein
MILVKFWFWSFGFFWTQRVCAGNLSASIPPSSAVQVFAPFCSWIESVSIRVVPWLRIFAALCVLGVSALNVRVFRGYRFSL